MNREFLKNLGLEDEKIDQIMAEHGKTVNSMKDELNKAKDLKQQIKDLQDQIKQRDDQLEDLKGKAAGNEDLQKQIQTLQDQNKQLQQDYEAKIQKQQFEFSLEKALTAAKVRNAKAVKALLDTEVIKLDGDKLLGLDEQLKNIKESDPYLFEEEKPAEPKKPQFMTGQHYKGSGGIDATAFSQMTYKERLKLKQENPELYESLSGRK